MKRLALFPAVALVLTACQDATQLTTPGVSLAHQGAPVSTFSGAENTIAFNGGAANDCVLGCTRTTVVSSFDGVTLSVQEWGRVGETNAPTILFIHGFTQSHLTWIEQVTNRRLLRKYRMVTFDLRGHGESDQPVDPLLYAYGDGDSGDESDFANDIEVIRLALSLNDKTTLVGHSLGSTFIADYLAVYGDADIGGVDFVGGLVFQASYGIPNDGIGQDFLDLASQVASTDIPVAIGGIRALVGILPRKPFTDEEADFIVAYNMMVPPEIRGFLLGPFIDHEAALRDTVVPVLITHGELDKVAVVELAFAMEETLLDAGGDPRLSVYRNVGHGPYFERTGRFNRELSALVDEVNDIGV